MTQLEAALAVARWLLLGAELQSFGALAVAACVGRYPLAQVLRPASLAIAITLPVWFVLQAIAIGEPHGMAAAVAAVWLVLTETLVGHVAALRALCWIACFALAPRHPGRALPLAGCALALHGGAGHATAAAEPLLQAAIAAHLLAAGAWLGGLLPLRLALRTGHPAAVARRFSWLGLVCVAILAATALVQGAALAGSWAGLPGTAYGRLLLLKLALFAALLAVAARNLLVLAPRLNHTPQALDRSLIVETALGLALIAAAALLSSQPPAAHEQPDWPFPWRPSLDVLADDDLRAEIAQALLALALAAACVLAATLHRRLRLAGPLAALAILWFTLPSLKLLLVPAEPTSFWRSTSAGDAAALARGAASYRRHCAICHGATGRGDGRLAALLPIPPADLTAPHLWDHLDGTLFWWISQGMTAPDGQVVMPGFASLLSEQTRWELIDFIHDANTAGATLPRAAHHH